MSTVYLRNTWYQAAWSHEIGDGGRLTRTLLDTPVLLLRQSSGKVAAVLDRCPHRFAPLSLGKWDGEKITCGYHGLAFDATGKCIHNPHGPVPSRAQAQSFPVVEKHAGVWIWFGDPARADPALVPDVGFIDPAPETARATGYMLTAANWQLIIDNLLDLAHSDYLHTAFGTFMTDAKMTLEERSEGLTLRWDARDGEVPLIFKSVVPQGKADMWVQANWLPPSVVGIEAGATPPGIPPKDCTQNSYHALTPETATTTHYFFLFTRNFRTDDVGLTQRVAEIGGNAFKEEDKPMIVAQQSRIGTTDFFALQPVLLSVDRGPVLARRKVAALIEERG